MLIADHHHHMQDDAVTWTPFSRPLIKFPAPISLFELGSFCFPELGGIQGEFFRLKNPFLEDFVLLSWRVGVERGMGMIGVFVWAAASAGCC